MLITNKHLIPQKGPMIVIANHPNTFLEAVLIAIVMPQPVYFLGKGTLFNTILKNRIMRTLYTIPVYRSQDDPTQMYKNESSFIACYKHLAEGKNLVIFPEGNSFYERKLRKIKTGTARIALGAVARQNFLLDLQIVTFGINFSNPKKFHSDVLINIAPAIDICDFKESYQKDTYEGVKILTTKIRDVLSENIIDTTDSGQDKLVQTIEDICGWETTKDFAKVKRLITRLNELEWRNSTALEELKQKVQQHQFILTFLNLSSKALSDFIIKKNFIHNVFIFLCVILGLPSYIYGFINNILAYTLPNLAAYLLANSDEFIGPIKMSTTLLSFVIAYFLQTYFIFNLTSSHLVSLLYLISLPISCYFAYHYQNLLRVTYENFRFRYLFQTQRQQMTKLLEQHQEIRKIVDRMLV